MILNIIVGFVIPFIFGIFLYRKDRKVIIFIAPIASVISFVINEIGYSSEWWEFSPSFQENETLSALPMDIGLFPFLACLMIHIMLKKNIKPFFMILIFSIFTTLIEFVGFILEKVKYQKGWNIFYTFLSYTCAYILGYLYFKLIKKSVFPQNLNK
jgi:hypothetical protein